MPPSAKSRIRLDPDTEATIKEQSASWGVLPATAVALAVQAQSPDPVAAGRAQSVLAAIAGGSAIPWRALTLPMTATWTLTLSMGGWVDSPSGPADPISRTGYGIATNWGFNDANVVASVRGYWSASPPTSPFRIVGFRLGLPVAHLWADAVAHDGSQIYVSSCLVEHHGNWVDADTGVAVRTLDTEDRAVSQALNGLIVVPSKSSNPVSWIKPSGVR